MKCPKCGADNPENAIYCYLCLHRFEQKQGRDTPDVSQPVILPGTGVPPPQSMTPSSDVFTRTYDAPPPPVVAQPDRRIRSVPRWLKVVAGVLITIVFFAGAWYVVDSLSKRDKTYSRPNSDLTFSYAHSWRPIDSEPEYVGKSTVGGLDMYDGVTVADSGVDEPKYVIEAGRLPGISPERWSDTKSYMKTKFISELAATSEPGVSISAPTFEDKTINGSQAFSVKFTANR
jgi:hypothetical protein